MEKKSNNNNNKFNKYQKNKNFKKENKEPKMTERKCQHCGEIMKHKGPRDCVGTVYWKCKNVKCGRTFVSRKEPMREIIPLTVISRPRF